MFKAREQWGRGSAKELGHRRRGAGNGEPLEGGGLSPGGLRNCFGGPKIGRGEISLVLKLGQNRSRGMTGRDSTGGKEGNQPLQIKNPGRPISVRSNVLIYPTTLGRRS